MSKVNLGNYKKGTIRIEIQSLIPERFINLLWKNGVHIKNITKLTITTMEMDINLSDYGKIEDIAKKTDTKIKIIDRRGLAFFILRLRRQFTLAGGIIIFVAGLYYLSTFIWNIDIAAGPTLTPYEVRQKLFSYGIRPGVPKSRVNVYDLEERMIKENDDIMWFKARIEGAKLKISLEERINPPLVVDPGSPCNIVAKMDGQIVRVYTTAGTAVVKVGEIVKSGQLLVKGEQGKEGSTYQVHAKGDIFANTFYENIREIQIKGTKNERTGQKIENTYVNLLGRKIYLKKTLNKFANYDRIEDNKKFIKKEVYFETKPKEFSLDKDKVVKDTVDAMYKKTEESLDKSARIVNKMIPEVEQINESIRIRVVFIVEQNIASEQAMQ